MSLRAALVMCLVVGACGGAASSTTTGSVTTTLSATTTLVSTTTTRVTIPGGDPLPSLPEGLGPLLIAESGKDQVLLVHPDGSKEVVLGGVPNPRGLGLSPDGLTVAVAVAGREPGEGAVILVTADRQVTTVVDGLDHPEGVMFLDADTLAFTGFDDRTINVIRTDGSRLRSVHIDGQPTGVMAPRDTSFCGKTGWGPCVAGGVLVATWEDGLFHWDPDTGRIIHYSLTEQRGLGHPGRYFGVCIPSTIGNSVNCLGSDTYRVSLPVAEPVAVARTEDRHFLLVTGSDGLIVSDRIWGPEESPTPMGPLATPAGIAVLLRSADAWLTADLAVYTPDTAFPNAAVQAVALLSLMDEVLLVGGGIDPDSILEEVEQRVCEEGHGVYYRMRYRVPTGTSEQADDALIYLKALGVPTRNVFYPSRGPAFSTPSGDIGLNPEADPGFYLVAETDCYGGQDL